jgi:hypothetical protein
MLLGRFLGILDENKNKVYFVVKCDTKEEAIKTANKYIKKKADDLEVRKVYLANEESDEFSFQLGKDGITAWAVFRK